jgi:hypothetical protein
MPYGNNSHPLKEGERTFLSSAENAQDKLAYPARRMLGPDA